MTRPGTDDPRGRVVPFCRRWHVIDEIDLVRLLAGHAELRTLCDLLEACADTLPVMPSPAQTTVLCQRLTVAIDRYARAGARRIDRWRPRFWHASGRATQSTIPAHRT